MSKNAPTIGPATSKMLLSLRALEEARQYYFDAILARGGKTMATDVSQTNLEKWDSIANMIREEVAWSVEVWSTGGSATI